MLVVFASRKSVIGPNVNRTDQLPRNNNCLALGISFVEWEHLLDRNPVNSVSLSGNSCAKCRLAPQLVNTSRICTLIRGALLTDSFELARLDWIKTGQRNVAIGALGPGKKAPLPALSPKHRFQSNEENPMFLKYAFDRALGR